MTENTALQVIRTDDLTTCQELRRIVFTDEQGVPKAEEIDDLDPIALLLLALDGASPVGTARIVVQDNIGRIGRVCVLQSHRGQGLGKSLILSALEQLRELPEIEIAQLGAQTHAIGLYQKLGFHVVGDEYLDAGIPHLKMERSL